MEVKRTVKVSLEATERLELGQLIHEVSDDAVMHYVNQLINDAYELGVADQSSKLTPANVLLLCGDTLGDLLGGLFNKGV
jgi:hypothetical protein